jgi:hypothetical protein
MSAFNIMVAVERSEANGYPHVNHVWFESMEIDEEGRTIKFGMGVIKENSGAGCGKMLADLVYRGIQVYNRPV